MHPDGTVITSRLDCEKCKNPNFRGKHTCDRRRNFSDSTGQILQSLSSTPGRLLQGMQGLRSALTSPIRQPRHSEASFLSPAQSLPEESERLLPIQPTPMPNPISVPPAQQAGGYGPAPATRQAQTQPGRYDPNTQLQLQAQEVAALRQALQDQERAQARAEHSAQEQAARAARAEEGALQDRAARLTQARAAEEALAALREEQAVQERAAQEALAAQRAELATQQQAAQEALAALREEQAQEARQAQDKR